MFGQYIIKRKLALSPLRPQGCCYGYQMFFGSHKEQQCVLVECWEDGKSPSPLSGLNDLFPNKPLETRMPICAAFTTVKFNIARTKRASFLHPASEGGRAFYVFLEPTLLFVWTFKRNLHNEPYHCEPKMMKKNYIWKMTQLNKSWMKKLWSELKDKPNHAEYNVTMLYVKY